jgi:hypothetical protein
MMDYHKEILPKVNGMGVMSFVNWITGVDKIVEDVNAYRQLVEGIFSRAKGIAVPMHDNKISGSAVVKNIVNYLTESGQAAIVGNEYVIEPKKRFVQNSSKGGNQIRLPDSVYKPNIQNSQFGSKR